MLAALSSRTMKTLRESWAWWTMGILLLLVFCWLGSASAVVGDVWKGMVDRMPLVQRLLAGYGPTACPVFGVTVAGGIILGDIYSRRWVQWCFVGIAAVLLALIVKAMFTPFFGTSTPHV